MTIVHLGSQRYEGLTADTKPTNVPAGALYRDTQLDIIYEYNGSSWDIIFGNTKTETLSNKEIDAALNTIKNLGGYKYEIFKSGSTYYCKNNQTGAIAVSNSSPNTVLQYPLTNGGTVYVHEADYVLTGNPSVYFDFPADPLKCYFIMDGNAKITVPSGFAGVVFRMTNSTTAHCNKNILSCNIEEAATKSNDWIGVLQEGQGSTNTVGVSRNLIFNSNFQHWYLQECLSS